MGILNRFRGGLELAITLDPAEVEPGDEFAVRVDVSGAIDDRLRAITVTFEGEGRYVVVRRDEFNSMYGEEEEWRVHSLHSESRELPLAIGPSQVRFRVPPDAPPSSQQVVEWMVTVKADREHAKDVIAREELSVILPADRAPATVTGGRPEYAGVRLVGLPTTVTNYDDISGTLEVELTEDTVCSDVWVGLERRCIFVGEADAAPSTGASPSYVEKVQTIDELVLEGKREFRADQCERYQFTLELDGSGPTTEHPHGCAEWVVRAALDRRRLGLNLEVEAPVFVLGEPDDDS